MFRALNIPNLDAQSSSEQENSSLETGKSSNLVVEFTLRYKISSTYGKTKSWDHENDRNQNAVK